MSRLAIEVNNLGKRYVIGKAQQRSRTLAEAIVRVAASPFSYLTTTLRQPGEDEILWALRNVSFEVEHGAVVGLIGRNGAGKSTLLKILSRITEPTEGEARMHGRVGSLLEVGTGFHPELTGRENVYMNGAVLGMRKQEIDRKFDEIVDFSGVEKFIDTPVKRYSSGMQVRLAFAVAAHLEPEILVVDEVLAVGDAEFQRKCLGKMEDVAGEGRTVLFVSHNMGAIRHLCPRSILLIDGQVEMNDNSADVISYYLDNIGGEATESERVWRDEDHAPGNDNLELRAVRVVQEDGTTASTLPTDKPITVEFSYKVKAPLFGMRSTLHLLNQEGVLAFVSTDHISRPYESQPGQYITRCTLPPHLLNNGRYYVQVGFDIPGQEVLLHQDTYVSFVAVKSNAQHGSTFPEHWPGVIAPRLSWDTVVVDQG